MIILQNETSRNANSPFLRTDDSAIDNPVVPYFFLDDWVSQSVSYLAPKSIQKWRMGSIFFSLFSALLVGLSRRQAIISYTPFN
jgi:hypothetical protein